MLKTGLNNVRWLPLQVGAAFDSTELVAGQPRCNISQLSQAVRD